jgi:hypothetical protein
MAFRYSFEKSSDLTANSLLDISKLPEKITCQDGAAKEIDGFLVSYEAAKKVTGFSAPIPEGIDNIKLEGCIKFNTLNASDLPKTIKSIFFVKSGIAEINGVIAEGLEKIKIQ